MKGFTPLQVLVYGAMLSLYLYACLFDPEMLEYCWLGAYVMPWDCETYVEPT